MSRPTLIAIGVAGTALAVLLIIGIIRFLIVNPDMRYDDDQPMWWLVVKEILWWFWWW